MSKKIICWVNKRDKKQFEKFKDVDIYFAATLEDFEKHIKPDTIPVFSLVLAASTHKEIKRITSSHPEIKFYFLQKCRIGLPVKNEEILIRIDDNIETSVMLPDEIIGLV